MKADWKQEAIVIAYNTELITVLRCIPTCTALSTAVFNSAAYVCECPFRLLVKRKL